MTKVIEERDESKPVIVWDTCQLAQDHAKYLAEFWDEDHEGEECPDEDRLFQMACGDQFLYDDAWEYMVEHLTEAMVEVAGSEDDMVWLIQGTNLGWMNRSGTKASFAETGAKLLGDILPKTDCTFRIFKVKHGGGEQLRIQNWHHDSPVGREWYYITPSADVYCRSCEKFFLDNAVEAECIAENEQCVECYEYFDGVKFVPRAIEIGALCAIGDR